ncbi:high mobility group B protein 7-like [Chenopodium quinoa]|uniref:HMG box domain-containing protein n=1 Tax=Chenopodium quinoa TaxID=63459 RepID=A0A803LS18_CHEQI|nr:high mobility group B protein 7-like [Chenopodium quinoa]
MAGGSTSSNPPKQRKRVEAESPDAESSPSATLSLKRAKDGSAFSRCEECNSSVPVALIDMHNCSIEAKIKMSLDATVVEKPAEVKKKPVERKKPSSSAAGSESKSKKRKLSKVKDPNMPKRPMSGYFVFMEEFRKVYKEEHPESKGVKEVAKEAGAKWKSMTDEEKKPYLDKAAELKVEYEKAMEAYNADNNAEEPEDLQAEELCDEDA